ncbi:MAG: hypothetical protein AAFV80_03515, partial [Bacteroidota bacterium]
VRITYQRLFECRIWHHYHLDLGQTVFGAGDAASQEARVQVYNVADFMEIIPSPETKRLLAGHRMRMIQYPLGFFVGMEADPSDTDRPFVELDNQAILRFYLKIKDPIFQNYSNLPLNNPFLVSDRLPMIYRFSNVGHADGHFPNLTAIAPAFDNVAASAAAGDGDPETFAYLAGDLLMDDQTTPTELFEAIRRTNSNTSSTADWNSITAPFLHFVNRNDQIRLVGAALNYTFSVPNTNVRLTATKLGSTLSRTQDFSTNDLLTHQLDLRNLPAGRYQIEAIDLSGPTVLETFECYLDETIRLGDIWGVIEIDLSETNGGYNLLDGGGAFNEPQFDLRIRNRSTFWRYLDETAFAAVAVDGADNPLPLTRDGFLSVTRNMNELPNPSAHRIRTEPDAIYSEIIIDQDLYNA